MKMERPSGTKKGQGRGIWLAGVAIPGMMAFLQMFFLLSVPADAETIEWDGLIEPSQVAKIGSPVPGILEVIHLDRGQMVKKGQVIAALQSAVERASFELARARADMEASIRAKKEELEFETRNQKRLKELFEKKAIPFNDWDQVETKRALAEHQLAEALENRQIAEMDLKRATEVLTRMSIKSPLNGVVAERYLNPGEYIETDSIMKIAQIDPLYVEVFLPVSTLGRVKVGMNGMVKPQEPCGGQYKAKVIVVDKVIDAASGTYGVRLELPNPEYKITAGLKCKVVFVE